jgi:hypothetical protein
LLEGTLFEFVKVDLDQCLKLIYISYELPGLTYLINYPDLHISRITLNEVEKDLFEKVVDSLKKGKYLRGCLDLSSMAREVGALKKDTNLHSLNGEWHMKLVPKF